MDQELKKFITDSQAVSLTPEEKKVIGERINSHIQATPVARPFPKVLGALSLALVLIVAGIVFLKNSTPEEVIPRDTTPLADFPATTSEDENSSVTPGLVPSDVPTSTSATSTATTTKPTPLPAEPTTYQFEVLDVGSQGGVDAQSIRVIETEAEWQIFWKSLTQGTKPAPQVEFENSLVIVLFAGSKSTGGHTVSVKSVTSTQTKTTLDVVVTEPGSTCIVTQAFTTPYQIVSVSKKASKPIVANWVREVTHCESSVQ